MLLGFGGGFGFSLTTNNNKILLILQYVIKVNFDIHIFFHLVFINFPHHKIR